MTISHHQFHHEEQTMVERAHQQMRFVRWLLPAMLAVFVGSTIGVSLPIWWLLEPAPKIIYGQPAIYVNGEATNTVKIGQVFQISREMCIGKTMGGTVQRELHAEGGLVIFIEALPVVTKSGCRVTTWNVSIPMGTRSGNYVYVARLEYQINPIRRVTVEPSPAVISVY